MKKLYTFYRESRDGGLRVMIREDYRTKKDFESDIRANGYRFIIALTESEIEDLKGYSDWTCTKSVKDVNKTLYSKGYETMTDIINLTNDYIIYEGL